MSHPLSEIVFVTIIVTMFACMDFFTAHFHHHFTTIVLHTRSIRKERKKVGYVIYILYVMSSDKFLDGFGLLYYRET